MPAREGKSPIARRPAESGSIVLGAVGAIVTYALDLDQDIAWTVPILVGAAPGVITQAIDYLASRFATPS